LTVHTARAGLAARAGHDLVIEMTSWKATLTLGDGGGSSLEATVDANSVEIRDGTGGMRPLTDSDREEIKKNLAAKVLSTDRNPTITFSSTSVTAGDRIAVDGRLALAGTTGPCTFQIVPDVAGTTFRASVRIIQSQFGIKPYSALMGSLKVADEVEVRAEVRVG
jgi:polyisoprenoid-binding protein YceI